MGDLWRRAWKGAIMAGSNMGGQASGPFSRLLGWPTDATDSLLLTAFPTLNLPVFFLFRIETRGTVHNRNIKGKRERMWIIRAVSHITCFRRCTEIAIHLNGAARCFFALSESDYGLKFHFFNFCSFFNSKLQAGGKDGANGILSHLNQTHTTTLLPV